ncbi:DUF455 family protein [Alicyclobacillus fodiniaquatilis]|uniref:DUF455 family protein n=1 Tax=Alicyclobacillus fodiniaquatilis TaxID=1661150 RepID=A0ABW4JNX0_9BACL
MPKYFGTDDALKKLKRFHSFEYDLLCHVIGFVPNISTFEGKCTLVRHSYEDLKRTRAIRERIQDFGVVHPEKQIQEAWSNVVRHLMTASDEDYFIATVYRVIKPFQVHAYRTYIESTLHLNDAPSVEAFEDHLPALERQIAWGKQWIEAGNIGYEKEQEIEKFEDEIREHIHCLGDLYQSSDEQGAATEIPVYPEFTIPTDMKLEPRFVWRSAERIYDTLTGGVESPAHHSYTHFTELPVIDICATIVYDGRHMPFEYIADFVRQTWDEVRHSRMGFSRLQSMGIDPYQVPIPVGHYRAYCGVPLLERISALTQVGEACSFAPKRAWVKMAMENGDRLTALEHDFDMVDEKNHVKFGARWLKEIMDVNKETRTPEQVVSDAEWAVRNIVNDLKKEKGEKWQEDLGERFTSCAESESPLNLAPKIIIS